MLKPSIESLLEKSGTRYALVIAVAKRARQLSEMDTIQTSSMKTVSLAIKEIDSGDVEIILK
jgi:DNA-directed RNA polymerase subunit omega